MQEQAEQQFDVQQQQNITIDFRNGDGTTLYDIIGYQVSAGVIVVQDKYQQVTGYPMELVSKFVVEFVDVQ